MLESPSLSYTRILTRLIQQSNCIRKMKQIHTQILTNPIMLETDSDFLISRLLFFVAIPESGCLNYGRRIFDSISSPNLPLYNIMIRAYASSEKSERDNNHYSALALYREMMLDGVRPNALTFPFLLKDCGKRLELASGCCVYGTSIKCGLDDDIFVGNSMISLYSLCGVVSSARKVFDKMSQRDVVSWNSMIIGFLRNGNLEEALELFERVSSGRNGRNIITWNSMITGFVQGGQAKKALDMFHEMQCGSDSVRPDKVTIASVLSACTYLGAIDHGKWIHSYLKRSRLEFDTVLATALVDMYGKCGDLVKAYEVFKQIPKKDTHAWTAMISAFALHGYVEEAFDLFERMKSDGVRPNVITFVGLLSACAHSGQVEKGRQCFGTMQSKYLIEPRVHHYACMVDILAKAGRFEEAEEVIRSMPMAPDVYVWGALLGGCLMQGNLELGEQVAKRLISLEPRNHAFYVALCDVYGKGGKFDDVKRVRELMKGIGIRKEVAGCSMIEVEGVVYEFSAGGSPDVMIEVVAEILNRLKNEIKDHLQGGVF